MGHYLSEMESAASAAMRQEQEAVVADLFRRGYRFPSGDTHVYDGGRFRLMMHQPCGNAVFDADSHDGHCPAS